VVFSEADLKKLEKISSQQVSSDLSIAESDLELAFTERFVYEPHSVAGCQDLRAGGGMEMNPLSGPWVEANGSSNLAVEERPLRSGIDVSLDLDLATRVQASYRESNNPGNGSPVTRSRT
jgi:hypothetical protein